MTKIYTKLIAMALALVLSVSVVLMSSYAWLVLSGNPVATGIQVTIGGGNTILTAPNVEMKGADGETYNIPGWFSNKLNFATQKQYDYLREVGSLTPVSTSNGIDWFLPAYYSGSDREVQEGRIASGTLKDISEFKVDRFLQHANLPPEEEEAIREGSYIYLDFWVVSPGGDYKLRIAAGDESSGGSFVIDLMQPIKENGEYRLAYPQSSASSMVRIGFLANDVQLIDDSMLTYQNSRYFDERFTSLRGLYQTPNTGAVYLDQERFTIYEPNGDSHPNLAMDGTYVATRPLALRNDVVVEQPISDRLTVQLSCLWKKARNSGVEETVLEQQFKTAMIKMDTSSMQEAQIANEFYVNYLQGQVSSFVEKGQFLTKTSNLYSYLINSGTANQEEMAQAGLSGATQDVYIIQLEKNVPQRIRMFIWLEGQDIDCVKNVDSPSFAVNIELAGGSE